MKMLKVINAMKVKEMCQRHERELEKTRDECNSELENCKTTLMTIK
jgi:hypothetical protein